MKTITPKQLEALRAEFGATVTSAQLYAYDTALLAAARAGALEKAGRGIFKLGKPVASASKKASDTSAIEADIASRFEALDLLGDAIVEGNLLATIISGAAGVGKSYNLEKKLKDNEHRLGTVTTIKGSISAIGLFMTLFEHSNEDDVILLDDIDSIFGDEEALNLLKGALDTNGVRRISWIKDSRFLADNDIPNSFDFNGRVVFLTNVDIQAVADKGGKMSPHMSALISRCAFLDLGIHSPEEIMIRVKQVLKTSDLGSGLSKAELQRVIDWLDAHLPRLRAISLRTVLQIAGFMKTTPNWQLLANTTLLRNR